MKISPLRKWCSSWLAAAAAQSNRSSLSSTKRNAPQARQWLGNSLLTLTESAKPGEARQLLDDLEKGRGAAQEDHLVDVEVDGVELRAPEVAARQPGSLGRQQEAAARLVRGLQADLEAVQLHLPPALPLCPLLLLLLPRFLLGLLRLAQNKA